MLDDFLVRAALAGLAVALVAGPLGCFVVWRRIAYFGDATAHAALLGVALSLGFSMAVEVGVLVTAAAMAFTVSSLSGRAASMDTLLGVAAHGALAVGVVAASFASGPAIELEAYLFGDILAVDRGDLAVVWGGAAAVGAVLLWRWSPLLTATLSPEIALAEGIDPRRERLALTLALAVVVAVAIKVVGALLITAMLIIPAAAARAFARSPEGMALIATAIGCAAVVAGLRLSWIMDAPTGPSIVVAATGAFLLSTLYRALRRAP